MNPYEDKIEVSERHPFSDRIMHIIKTSITNITELAVVSAGQIYFTTIEMIVPESKEETLLRPKAITFDLDELYVEDGSQISRCEEYEPNKFIALTWWTNKIYLFKREKKDN